jgi:Mg2+/citrate symporter
MELNENYFGSRGKVREYKILFYLGLGMIIAGGPLTSLGFFNNMNIEGTETPSVIGIVLLGIGALCIVSGWLGLREEKQKYGIKRKSTWEGNLALVFGILSVFIPQAFPLPFIFGILAIILAYKSVKQGDNVYGSAGGICGMAGIIVELYVWILFMFFL